ncbi:Acetyl-coenzyme A carboxylase carboxyl transferase subunit beta,acetyl-CoA carboxylase subunit beta,Acetyl-CoA carboxylase, carboxyltransferase component (subunits alpha and beta),acetyl-CoA carboxylase, carboxyl transferase, beta subunit,Carboxyl transferase domain [Chlamydia poikilotherma]|uniref:Acetyl-coenzyme A carboxylase carboxyl transferase subunit beta n=1 Tax=Chlamydia poikilotherma TaxID=1967783 RepID=A0A3B0PP25_9CHLA|nr:acetyl-CoA carboxylase, carboxyltransferase subunit beta [Chlamydia poikilotherma]SYX08830.1 Acetyl-coenzyme A carboxylase carboxyl transferase subunit beta,acetyl-CoA carboxylase subunit beta,Acetyl-CoA carboxylase, carboxyltransferase component (subunits alpha and beta),acetyl-CoA carboxylase, carboxyl transferase, beta subunit,Carboxyl transferase domain [Chlamydia poikilotherma]
MRLFSYDKPKIKVQKIKADGFSGWLKCTYCHEMIHANELGQNFNCCPKCSYHYRITAAERIKLLADKDSWRPLYTNLKSQDPLKFVDTDTYPNRLTKARKDNTESEGVLVGVCAIGEHPVALAVMDFNFMAGSMGAVVGEKLTRLVEKAVVSKLPVIIVCASGGARMQESVFSLMQMAKTSAALAKLHEAGLPYISVLTNPTSGGVTASFASLGDVIIAEPKALICFAGPRVVAQVIGEDLPEGAQKSEFLLEHGMIDKVVERKQLKSTLQSLLDYFCAQEYTGGQDKAPRDLSKTLKEIFLLTDDSE